MKIFETIAEKIYGFNCTLDQIRFIYIDFMWNQKKNKSANTMTLIGANFSLRTCEAYIFEKFVSFWQKPLWSDDPNLVKFTKIVDRIKILNHTKYHQNWMKLRWISKRFCFCLYNYAFRQNRPFSDIWCMCCDQRQSKDVVNHAAVQSRAQKKKRYLCKRNA